MKKFIIFIVAVGVVSAAGLAVAKLASQQEENSSSGAGQGEETVCDLSKKTEFQLQDKTTFQIPEAYIYNPHTGVPLKTKPADYIWLYIRKDTLGPECRYSHTASTKKDYLISIQAIKPGSFKRVIEHYAELFPVRVKEEGEFVLYHEQQKEGRWMSYDDLLIPESTNFESLIFLKCSKGLHTDSMEVGKSCTVYSAMPGTGFLQYEIQESELGRYKEIDENIKSLVKSFQIISKKEKR